MNPSELMMNEMGVSSHKRRYSGPEVIKLSRVRTCIPNRTPCSKSFSYSRGTVEGYKTFLFSYSYSSGVQISNFSSKLHSWLGTILKVVSVQNKSMGRLWFHIYVSIISQSIICLYAFTFCEERGCNISTYI